MVWYSGVFYSEIGLACTLICFRHLAGNVVSELDPDAPGRQGRVLHPDTARAEERLLQRCWALVRAGGVRIL